MESELVKMTPEERAEFEAFRAEKAKEEAEKRAREERETYKQLVEDTVNQAFPKLQLVSEQLKQGKQEVIDLFKLAIAMKEQIFGIKTEQLSHTFSSVDGTKRITIGRYLTDNWDDTVNEGITKVNEAIQSLARDENSRTLVKAVLRLLSKDSKGTLKASRVLQLRKMADESGNREFIDGVRIIEESYQPIDSRLYIRCEQRQADAAWENIPLGMTEA